MLTRRHHCKYSLLRERETRHDMILFVFICIHPKHNTPLCGDSCSLQSRLSLGPVEQHVLSREPRVIGHLLTADLHSSDEHSTPTGRILPSRDGRSHTRREDGVRQRPPAQPGQRGGLRRRRLGRFRHGGRTARGQQSLEVKTGVTPAGGFGREGGICGLQDGHK